jgi:DNA replication protein DnaC
MEQQTIEKMNLMHMKGMSTAYHEDITTGLLKDYTIDEYLSKLVDTEWEHRQSRKIQNLKRGANFRQQAHPLNIDYTINRNLDKGVMTRLLSLTFIKQSENIIITGFTGTGKSYLAQCIGTKACEMLYRVSYYPMSELSDTIELMQLQGNYSRWIKRLQQSSVLILDDFGLAKINDKTRKTIMDLVDFKYGRSSVIIVSQIPVQNWHELIGESTIADAILDRIVHNAHRIELKGESIRRQKGLSK